MYLRLGNKYFYMSLNKYIYEELFLVSGVKNYAIYFFELTLFN